jgi:hypothetical protein
VLSSEGMQKEANVLFNEYAKGRQGKVLCPRDIYHIVATVGSTVAIVMAYAKKQYCCCCCCYYYYLLFIIYSSFAPHGA